MALPIDSSHLTRLSPLEMEAVFSHMVESRFARMSIANQFWPSRIVTGTNSYFNRYFGKTALQAVTPGVRPDALSTPMTRRGVVVDTTVLARNNVDLLNDVQADFDIPSEISQDQGKEHAQFFDETFFGQLVKAAQQPAMTGVDSIPAGVVETLGTGEQSDPDAFVDGITAVLSTMRLRDIPSEELVVFVDPIQFDILLRNEKLVSRDFTDQGADFALRKMYYVSGVRIEETNSLPKVATAAGEHHLLSNASNSYAYDVTASDARAVAAIGHSKSLMPAQSIMLSSKIWYNNEELQWFVDSYIAFAVTWNRPDVSGVVLKAA